MLLLSGLATPDVQVGRRELDHLLECRAAIRDLLDSNLTGRADPAASIRLAHLAADHPVTLTDGSGEALSLDLSPATSVDGVISQMIGIVFQAQLEGQWSRLKVCASDECRWAFFDSSRNQGGTWCQMETCGNRVKNRSYRRRASARRHAAAR